MEYTVQIEERLVYEETVEAESLEEAISIIETKYYEQEIILTAEEHVETIFREAPKKEDSYVL